MKKHFFYLLGDNKVYPHSLEIKSGEKCHKIQKKVMQVLLVLINYGGKVVTKDEIAKEVWGNTIVSENSLMKIISELRKILGNRKDNLQYIETVPKVGYRLLITPIKSELAFGPVNSKKGRLLSGLILMIVLSVLSVGLWIQQRNQKADDLAIISPNGKFVLRSDVDNDSLIFTIEDIQGARIWRVIKVQFPERIAVNWAPDNERVVFNATLAKDNFYTVCIYTIESEHLMYIRFAKPGKELGKVTADIDSLKEIVMHSEIRSGEVRVEFLQVSAQDTVKMLMDGADIVGFEW